MYYEAEAVTVPARDPRSVLPETVARIDVTYQLPLGTDMCPIRADSGRSAPGSAGGRDSCLFIQTTLTRPGDIAALVAAFNALPRDSLEPHGCLPDQGARATLVFVKGDGSTLTATIDPACSRVAVLGYPPLVDGGLWTTITRIVTHAHLRAQQRPHLSGRYSRHSFIELKPTCASRP